MAGKATLHALSAKKKEEAKKRLFLDILRRSCPQELHDLPLKQSISIVYPFFLKHIGSSEFCSSDLKWLSRIKPSFKSGTLDRKRFQSSK